MIKRESLKSPEASCSNPVTSGPKVVPMELIIIMKAMPIANSLGFIPLRWNGTEYRTGQNPQPMPLINVRTINNGMLPVNVIPVNDAAISAPRTSRMVFPLLVTETAQLMPRPETPPF